MTTPSNTWDAFDRAPTQAVPATVQDWNQFDQAPQTAPIVTPAPTHPTMAPSGNTWSDRVNFLRSMVSNTAAGIVGIPDQLSKLDNSVSNWYFQQLGMDPNDAPKTSGSALPTTDKASDFIYNHTAPEYKPTSTFGRYAMAAGSTALPAIVDPETALPNAIRMGAAGLAAQGAQDAGLPGWVGPIATTAAELALRKGVGLAAPHMSSGATAKGATVASELPAVPATAAPAVAGTHLTVGQLTGDPQWLALDDELGNTPAAQRNSATRLAGNQAVIRDAVGNVAPGASGSDAAVEQASNVSAADTAAKNAVNKQWQAISPDVRIDNGTLKTTLDQHMTGLVDNGDDAFLPANIKTVVAGIQGLPDEANLPQLQARRSSLVTAARDARNAGDTNASRVIGGIADVVGNHLDDESNLLGGAPADLAQYRAARSGTQNYYSTFGDSRTAGAQIPDLVSGKIAPESTLSRFLPAGPEGNGTQSLSRLKMSVGTGMGLDPSRSYLVGKLRDAVSGGPEAFGKVLDDYGYAFKDKDMFTPEQLATINDAQDAMAQTYRTSPAGAEHGSPTLSTLQSPTFARALYGNIAGRILPRVPRFVGGAIGGAVAKMIGVPGAEEIPGQLFGGEAVDEATQGAMKNARNSIVNIVDRARQDPALARQLQMKATAGNLKLASRVRSVLPALGLSEAMMLPRAQ